LTVNGTTRLHAIVGDDTTNWLAWTTNGAGWTKIQNPNCSSYSFFSSVTAVMPDPSVSGWSGAGGRLYLVCKMPNTELWELKYDSLGNSAWQSLGSGLSGANFGNPPAVAALWMGTSGSSSIRGINVGIRT